MTDVSILNVEDFVKENSPYRWRLGERTDKGIEVRGFIHSSTAPEFLNIKDMSEADVMKLAENGANDIRGNIVSGVNIVEGMGTNCVVFNVIVSL